MFSQFIVLLLVLGLASIQSLPIKKARRTVSTRDASSPVYIPRLALDKLLDVNPSKGLFRVSRDAKFLSKDELLIPEVKILLIAYSLRMRKY